MNSAIRPRTAGRKAFTLLEVILALAVLAGSLAMLTEGLRSARRNGQIAAKLTLAEILAAGKMAELAAQITPLASATEVPCETEPDFVYSITLGQTPVVGLVAVTVTVATEAPGLTTPVVYSLTQWMTDPGVAADEAANAEAANATNTSSNAASSNARGSNGP